MKSQFFRASSTLAVLTLLVAFGLSAVAQERPRQPAQEQEPQLRELAVQQLDSETLRIAVPPQCKGITPDIQTHNSGTGVTLSPALANFLSGKPVKGYSNPAVNKYFGDSFRLRNCRVCYATLEVNVRHYNDVFGNDSLTVGAAPFSTSPGVTFLSTAIWGQPTPNPKAMTFALPGLNNYVSTTSTLPSFLDLVAQDDTDFASARLTVWYY